MMVPLDCSCHTWLESPVQSHNCTFVPVAVPWFDRSRHLFAIPVNGVVVRVAGATPRKVPSDPTHNAGIQGQSVPLAAACCDSSIPPVCEVLNHIPADIAPDAGSRLSGSRRDDDVPLKVAPVASSNGLEPVPLKVTV